MLNVRTKSRNCTNGQYHQLPRLTRHPNKAFSPSRARKPHSPWIVGLIATATFVVIESLCYLIDHYQG
jgi:hypothetical protein